MIDCLTIIISTLIIESITLAGRFLLKISSKEIMIKIMKKLDLKRFIHLHHGFIGIAVSALAYYYGPPFFFNLGIGLLLSDIIHHFIVLNFIVGDPEFHIIYKNIKEFKKEQKEEKRKLKRFFKNLIHHA